MESHGLFIFISVFFGGIFLVLGLVFLGAYFLTKRKYALKILAILCLSVPALYASTDLAYFALIFHLNNVDSKKLCGTYHLKAGRSLLVLSPDRTCRVEKTPRLKESGDCTWRYDRFDSEFGSLTLEFPGGNKLRAHHSFQNNGVLLKIQDPFAPLTTVAEFVRD